MLLINRMLSADEEPLRAEAVEDEAAALLSPLSIVESTMLVKWFVHSTMVGKRPLFNGAI